MRKLYFNRIQLGVRLMVDVRYKVIDDTIQNFTTMRTIDFELLKSINKSNVKTINTKFPSSI